MAGAELAVLNDRGRAMGFRQGFDFGRAGRDDDDGLDRAEGGGDIQHMAQHRPAADRVQHLGQSGLHPRPLACGKDHNGKTGLGHREKAMAKPVTPACREAGLRDIVTCVN